MQPGRGREREKGWKAKDRRSRDCGEGSENGFGFIVERRARAEKFIRFLPHSRLLNVMSGSEAQAFRLGVDKSRADTIKPAFRAR